MTAPEASPTSTPGQDDLREQLMGILQRPATPKEGVQPEDDLRAQLLDLLVAKLPPLLLEGVYMAAVPHSFTLELITALRARDDGKDEKLIARLQQFSFVNEVEDPSGKKRYVIMEAERDILRRRFIASNPQGFILTHQRALAFRETHPHTDPAVQDLSRIYHRLMIDTQNGLDYLIRVFTGYTSDHRLSTAERLMQTAHEVIPYLEVLNSPLLPELRLWLRYFHARLDQLRGEWANCLAELKSVLSDPTLPRLTNLQARVTRAYALALTKAGEYADAISYYEKSVALFKQQPASELEQAFTLIGLGDAHLELALAARGYRMLSSPKVEGLQRVRVWLTLPLLIPLLIYMHWHFSWRVWQPQFWPVLIEQDWIISRLLVIAARWYQQANRLLLTIPQHPERTQAAEKLARLYLALGDADEATHRFLTLLSETQGTLSQYRRARAEAGLGHSLLRLGQTDAAVAPLRAAVPILNAYDDREREAEALSALAEAVGQLGQSAEAMQYFDRAMRLYQKQDDVVGATEMAERLHALERSQQLDTEERGKATTTTQRLQRRQYQVRFRHPALIVFRRLMLVLLAGLIFLVPLVSTRVESGSTAEVRISFFAAPLLENDAQFSPLVAQDLTLRLEPIFQTELAFQLSIGLVLSGLVLYAALGLLLIATTPLRALQAAQREAIRLDLQGVETGHGEQAKHIGWRDITHLIEADVYLFENPLPENSSFTVVTPNTRIKVSGYTAWYAPLWARIWGTARFIAPNPQVLRLGYRTLQSPLGWLYLVSIVGLLLFGPILRFATDWLTMPLFGSPYSLNDFYPFFYLGLLLPPLWWLVVRPTYIQRHLNPQSRLIWLLGTVGLVLAVGALFVPFLPRFGLLGLHIATTSLVLIGSSVWAVWQWQTPNGHPVQSLPVRLLLTLVLVIGGVFVGARIRRELNGYHALVYANNERKLGLNVTDPAESDLHLKNAIDSYSQVLENSPDSTDIYNNRALIYVILKDYPNALKDYDAILEISPDDHPTRANRALAYQSWAAQLTAAGDTTGAQEKLAAALSEFNHLIQQDPDDPRAYLWRGIVYHTLKQPHAALDDYRTALNALRGRNAEKSSDADVALMGAGWAWFQIAHDASLTPEGEATATDNFRKALESFEEANEIEENAETWLAVGYAHFRLKDYAKTLEAWERAVELDPENSVMVISRGTAHWRLANVAGQDTCASETASTSDKALTAGQLQMAVNDFTQAIQLDPNRAPTYRTRAQVEYLLRNCPGYDYDRQMSVAIADYGEAIKRAPENAVYWQFRARLGYVHSRDLFFATGHDADAQTILAQAVSDLDHAAELDPTDAETKHWQTIIHDETLGRSFYLERGQRYYTANEYTLAFADFSQAATLLPNSARAAFKAGLAALAAGEMPKAQIWYATGLQRTPQLDPALRADVLRQARDDLNALLKTQPNLRPEIDRILRELERGGG